MDKVAEILMRFPGPVTMPVSRLKMVGMLLIGLVFVAGGVFMTRSAEPDTVFWGWLCLIFFGLCTIAAAVMLLPGAGSLTLGPDGFTVCTFFRKHHTSWRQASDFTVGGFSAGGAKHSLVAYNDAKASGFAAESSRGIVGRSASLPDTYGLSHADLADLLTQWRARALAATQP